MAKVPSDTPKSGKAEKQSTLMGFFGKPKPGPAPARTASAVKLGSTTSTSPASTTLKTPSSVAGSSPTVSNSTQKRQPPKSPVLSAARSPLRVVAVDQESDDELSPPPVPVQPVKKAKLQPKVDLEGPDEEDMHTEGAVDSSPPVSSRRAKRKIVYAESGSDGSGSDVDMPSTSTSKNGRKPRKSLKADSDSDDYVFDEQDDIAFVAALDEYEMSPGSPGSEPPDSPQRTKSKKAKPQSRPSKTAESSPISRPPVRPLVGASSSRNHSNRSDSHTNSFATAAEKRKEKAAQDKRESEDCFDFLKPDKIKDKDGNRPGDPEYDPRTIHIPQSALDRLSPFEQQFWSIKKDHYDTVLFFQKGKFFELYEEDARIGHREFDLKLTDRVKMCMVGVPEQQFEIWAAKFLAAGYKVGKVQQAETAIGKEMRSRGGPAEKIVRRELQQVFTNGTIVDPTYLTSDDANHCVAIKEHVDEASGRTSFGICTLDASTGEFNLSAFEDDIVRTRLQTTFGQIRPKELIHAKGNLSVETQRLLRNILPSATLWQSFRDGREFFSSEKTQARLAEIFETTDADGTAAQSMLPPAIESMLDSPIAMEALGGMLYYLKSLNLEKDLISQKNFNIYDPIKEGKNLVLDGVTLGHMEVLVNNEGGTEGTLLELLQRCQTPSGKRLFRIWLASPLLDAKAINERLDAVEDLMASPSFTGSFRKAVQKLPDLERLLSRLHAGTLRESAFLSVVEGFERIQDIFESLTGIAENFASSSVGGLLRTAPELQQLLRRITSLYNVNREEKSLEILPKDGADQETDEAKAEVSSITRQLDDLLASYKRRYKISDMQYWHSAQGGKDIFQVQVPATAKSQIPKDWVKQSGTSKYHRYYNSELRELIRAFQEAKETESTAKKDFYRRLLAEFDQDRTEWLKAVRIVAELDCLASLALASHDLDEPKCRPQFVEADHAFVDFEELRHPSMCLRSDFIANDVKLGGPPGEEQPRTVLLTGPNMAGKSTLLRMTAAGIIMAQIGCFVPAAKARLAPIDKIQTRMGAYDNMFASASTFKVELDETSKIIREAGPKSFVILDELGRGTSTYDGMAIAGSVLHHLATHTLPLAFFATHYGSLTDDYRYHPNIVNKHMQTFVDDAQRQVVFLYKLIDGVAESSHGTHVAKMAGVPMDVVDRADSISHEFFRAFKEKLASRRQSEFPLEGLADFAWLLRLALPKKDASGDVDDPMLGVDEDGHVAGRWKKATRKDQLEVIKRAVGRYAVAV